MLQDLRYAVRMLIKNRWLTCAAVSALALGIGANAVVFTLVNAVFLRGLPYENSDRIVSMGIRDARDRERPASYLDYLDWRENSRSFSKFGASSGAPMTVADTDIAAERFPGVYISADGLGLVGQSPQLGRLFTPAEDTIGAPPVVVLGHTIWVNRYDRDPSIVGRVVRVNGVPCTVIGVMPEGFRYPNNNDIWQPLSARPNLATEPRDRRNVAVLGMLAPGVTIQQATAELTSIADRLQQQYPETNTGVRASLMTWVERQNGGPIRLMFFSLMGAVAFVLLIACANVASLLLSRAAQRAPEMAVRVSVGATRWQIVRQLLTESVLMAVLGGLIGLGLAVVGVQMFESVTADPALGRPYWIQFTMDAQVLAFFAAVCLGTGVLFGLAPALHVARGDLSELLKEGGRSGSGGVRARRWTSGLLVFELALTLVLLAGAGFMMRSFMALYQLELGVDAANLTIMRIDLPEQKYPTLEQRLAFFDGLEERLGGIASLPSATFASTFPMGGGANRQLEIEGRPVEPGVTAPTVTSVLIGSRYFETLGLTVRGRSFSPTDGGQGLEPVIVNQRFAALHFPDRDAIGQRIRLTDENVRNSASQWLTIIGVSPTIRQSNPQDLDPGAVVYRPFRADPVTFAILIARSPGGASQAASVLRDEVRALDADLPLFNIRTLEDQLTVARWPYRVFGTMFTIFAGIALLLSGVGLYAVTARSVTERTQEIGVRLVLGANPSEIQWLIIRQGALKVVLGLVVGLAGAIGVGTLLSTLLVQTSPRDPLTLTGIAVLLAVIASAACTIPARRATRLNPLSALRNE
jgi:putative ABC transport system permease protein